ncbi:hypothetical protein DIPPA_08780 [Diplonema papillatum]|nr:hypothetical protein DIPPA_08780 [Diplonema papillatum]
MSRVLMEIRIMFVLLVTFMVLNSCNEKAEAAIPSKPKIEVSQKPANPVRDVAQRSWLAQLKHLADNNNSVEEVRVPIENTKDTVGVRCRKTKIEPSFYFAYADPRQDQDASKQVARRGVLEIGISRVWNKHLSECCMRNGERGTVVDVGGNMGWYSVLSAMHGCRVIAWEPVPKFRAFFEASVALNSISDLIEIRPRVASNESTGIVRMVVPTANSWGRASLDSVSAVSGYEIFVDRETVDSVVAPDTRVCVMKVDVEGYEPYVFSGAKNLIKSGNVENVMFEYTPLLSEKTAKTAIPRDAVTYVDNLLDNGYNLYHLHAGKFSISEVEQNSHGFWDKPIKGFVDFITKENLQHDFDDCERAREHDFRHHFEPHNMSFRSSFGYNTNVWGSFKDRSFTNMPGTQKRRSVRNGVVFKTP